MTGRRPDSHNVLPFEGGLQLPTSRLEDPLDLYVQ